MEQEGKGYRLMTTSKRRIGSASRKRRTRDGSKKAQKMKEEDEIMPVHPIVDWDKIYQTKTFKIEFTVSKDATSEEIRQACIDASKKYWETEKQKNEQEVLRLFLESIKKGTD